MENKFNDFSRFKNNELRSYFRKKEYNRANLKNPFSSSILSGLTIAFLWSARDNYQPIIENIWLKFLFYPLIILTVYSLLYFIFFFLIDKIGHFFNKLINSTRIGQTKKKDKYYLDKFKFEVVNQVSLALSIISHRDDDLNKYSNENKAIVEIENRFYVVEAFYHLTDALEILQTDILLTPFYKKIIDDNYTKINRIRIKELVDLSTCLYLQFRKFWKEQDVEESYSTELNELRTTIQDIKERLK
jgi:hypothetical protein